MTQPVSLDSPRASSHGVSFSPERKEKKTEEPDTLGFKAQRSH